MKIMIWYWHKKLMIERSAQSYNSFKRWNLGCLDQRLRFLQLISRPCQLLHMGCKSEWGKVQLFSVFWYHFRLTHGLPVYLINTLYLEKQCSASQLLVLFEIKFASGVHAQYQSFKNGPHICPSLGYYDPFRAPWPCLKKRTEVRNTWWRLLRIGSLINPRW